MFVLFLIFSIKQGIAMEHDIFISYSSKDKDIAFAICNMLENNNLQCWIAPRNVVGGKSYAREIIEAINASTVVLFIFSDNSNKSEHVENEIDNAFAASKIIIPFRISDTSINPELKYYLNKKHWINGIPSPFECFSELLEAIKKNIPRCCAEMKASQSAEVITNMLNSEDEVVKNANMLLEVSHQINEKLKFYECESLPNEDDFIETSTEGRYEIIQNAEGKVVIIINARKSEPYNPRLVYDGGAHALLYRNKRSAVVLDSLHIDARPILKEQESVCLIEVFEEDVYREYDVIVRIVKDLEELAANKCH